MRHSLVRTATALLTHMTHPLGNGRIDHTSAPIINMLTIASLASLRVMVISEGWCEDLSTAKGRILCCFPGVRWHVRVKNME